MLNEQGAANTAVAPNDGNTSGGGDEDDDRDMVGVTEAVEVMVGVIEAVAVDELDAVHELVFVCVLVAVVEGLAPYVRLPVAVAVFEGATSHPSTTRPGWLGRPASPPYKGNAACAG